MPAFSVITPSLNQGRFLGECLESVRRAAACANADVQHIVRDGGSSDETLDVLRAASDVEWESALDKGQTDAINQGLRIANGTYVCYLCADDVLEPNALELVARAFAENPAADVVYGDGYFLEAGWKRRKRAGDFSVARLRRGNFLIQPAVFWRRAVNERFGLFNDRLRFCMDHEFWLRICGETRWHYIAEPLASSRLHADAKTWTQLVPAWDEARQMQRGYGIRWRPLRDALWMRLGGSQYYRFKRAIFAAMARRRIS